MKIRVYHAYYGCDTGCCGHIVDLEGKDQEFRFKHLYIDKPTDEQKKEFAIELAKKVVSERWPECMNSIDWDSIQFDEVSDD